MLGVNDKERVRRAIDGDGTAFAELVGQYRDAVYGVCYHRAGHATPRREPARCGSIRRSEDDTIGSPPALETWHAG